MKTISALLITLLFVISVGCGSGGSAGGSSSDGSGTGGGEATISGRTDEIEAKVKKIVLSPGEWTSLKQALGIASSPSGNGHVHVDSKGNQLTFGADHDASHLPAANQTITVGSSPAARITTTPAARGIITSRAHR
jgi:hypothetical protein